MSDRELIHPTPWDSTAFGIPTFEIDSYDEATLKEATSKPGHYTVRVDPLADKRLLHRYNFYYCDTLIEPFVSPERYRPAINPEVSMKPASLDEILPMCEQNFMFGRFHRDFNLNSEKADDRYKQWTKQLFDRNVVRKFLWRGNCIGFIAMEENAMILHAMHRAYQGQGLAKGCWSLACDYLFAEGHHEITSSVSAANLAVVNLYASLGFRFYNARDIYHCLIS